MSTVGSRWFVVLSAMAVGSLCACTSHNTSGTAKPAPTPHNTSGTAKPASCPTTREGPSRGLTLVPGTATATIDADKVVSVFVKSADLGAPSLVEGATVLSGPTGAAPNPEWPSVPLRSG